MRKAPEPTKEQGAFQNHQQQGDSIKSAYFSGTDNPRHLRAIHALWVSPQPREAIDNRAGCSNGPELIAELRRPGVYRLSEADRRKVHQWQARRGGAA